MKKIIPLAIVVFVMSALFISTAYSNNMGPGMMGPSWQAGQEEPQQWNYCPYCGRPMGRGYGYGMGPGMMGRGYGMGPWMGHGGWGIGPGGMHQGWGMGPNYGPGYQGQRYQQSQKPLDESEAKSLMENYLKSTRNPNIELGDIEDKGNVFEAKIQTKDGSLVDKIIIDKMTGWIRSIY